MKGDIRNMTALPYPILAGRKGTNDHVQIIGLGDVEGHSPSCWVVDNSGDIQLEPLNKFTVLEPRFLPSTLEPLTAFANQGRTGSGVGIGSRA